LNIMSGHKSKLKKMDLFVRTPDTSKNRKRWIIYVQSWIPAKNKIWIIYVRTQVKIAKDGFDLCPDTSQNRKRWI